jgi:hypothetical protein
MIGLGLLAAHKKCEGLKGKKKENSPDCLPQSGEFSDAPFHSFDRTCPTPVVERFNYRPCFGGWVRKWKFRICSRGPPDSVVTILSTTTVVRRSLGERLVIFILQFAPDESFWYLYRRSDIVGCKVQ